MKSRVLRILLVVAAGILLMPLDASAQTSAKVYRIGVLDMTPPDLRSPAQMAFYEELRQRGYVEGQKLITLAPLCPQRAARRCTRRSLRNRN